MQDKSLVTIICLCYNHEKYVVESLFSAINQNYKLIELIIVDDYSNDNSKETILKWLTNYPKVKFIANEANIGNTRSFNKALKLAKGDYIIDLAADDILLPDCVSLQIKTFQKSIYKNLGVVYGNAELITENGKFDSYYFPIDSSKKIIEKRKTGDIYISVLSGGNSICSVSSMIKKNVFNDLIGYDETLAYEDLDFWIRASRSYEFDFIDVILIKKRILSNSLSATFFLKKNNQARKVNHSTYLIIKKAIKLNKTREEDLAVQKRIHYGIVHAIKVKDTGLLYRYFKLRIWLFWRRVNNNY